MVVDNVRQEARVKISFVTRRLGLMCYLGFRAIFDRIAKSIDLPPTQTQRQQAKQQHQGWSDL